VGSLVHGRNGGTRRRSVRIHAVEMPLQFDRKANIHFGDTAVACTALRASSKAPPSTFPRLRSEKGFSLSILYVGGAALQAQPSCAEVSPHGREVHKHHRSLCSGSRRQRRSARIQLLHNVVLIRLGREDTSVTENTVRGGCPSFTNL